MKKYKTTLSPQNADDLINLIECLVVNFRQDGADMGDAVAFAALSEIVLEIRKKRVKYICEYKISFTPTQAISLVYLYTLFIEGSSNTNQFTNRMLQINNEILQQFSL